MYIDTTDPDRAPASSDREPLDAPRLLSEIACPLARSGDVLPPLWIGPADNIRPEFE